MITPFPHPSRSTSSGGRARVLFYSADLTGLGNVRRTLAVAREVAMLRPDAALICLTGGLQTHAYELPVSFDYVKLPTAAKLDLYQHVAPSPDHPQGVGGILALRERLAFETITAFSPDVVLVDNLPAGVGAELTRALTHLRETNPHASLLLGLRDVVDEPSRVGPDWTNSGLIDLVEHLYDRILIYGCPEVIDPLREYGLPDSITARMTICGYVRRPEEIASPEAIRAHLDASDLPLIVVSVGGGALGAHLLRLYFEMLRQFPAAFEGMISLVVTGPLMAAERTKAAQLEDLAAGILHLHVVPFVEDLMSYLNAADVVVTVGGQTLVEAISLGKRAIALPEPTARDQYVRAQRLAGLGLCTWIPTAEQTTDRLKLAIEEALNAPAFTSTLDFGGRERAGAIVAGLLPHSVGSRG